MPGYGAYTNNDLAWDIIVENIENRFLNFYENENLIERENEPDEFIHACLYFISPNCIKLKQLDIECLKRLQNIVNIILGKKGD